MSTIVSRFLIVFDYPVRLGLGHHTTIYKIVGR